MIVFESRAAVPHWNAAPDPGAVLAFSTRAGGVSRSPYDTLNLGRSTEDEPAHVLENRRRLLSALELDPALLVTAGQVHGARVVEAMRPGHLDACDALWTRVAGLPLAVTAADCVPVLYRGPGVVAAAHAGWRGIAAGLPTSTLGAMSSGARTGAAAFTVAIGPCIRRCCYVVGEDVAAQFDASVISREHGTLHLDLVAAVRDQLLAAGIRSEAIFDTEACTSCDVERCFSHRRDRGRTGRMWGVVALRDGTPKARTAHERRPV